MMVASLYRKGDIINVILSNSENMFNKKVIIPKHIWRAKPSKTTH